MTNGTRGRVGVSDSRRSRDELPVDGKDEVGGEGESDGVEGEMR